MTAATEGNTKTRSDTVSDKNGGVNVIRTDAAPRLLVSVRSLEEADIALRGGADILDIKEPLQGSLGMASLAEITAIAHRLERGLHPTVPLSVALGEITDWSEAVIPTLPEGINFAKLGLSRCSIKPDWVTQWLRVRTVFEQRTSSQLRWVAVAYADVTAAAAPGIFETCQAAIETKCAGLLIDTWTKDKRNLMDELDAAFLSGIAARCHASGLFLALAGRLTRDLLPELSGVGADILAIRSAGCRGSDRTAELDSTRVSEFRQQMHQCCLSRL